MTIQGGAVAAPRPLWQRWLIGASSIVIVLVGVARMVSAFTGGHALPACDSRRAKDMLSDVFKEKDLKPTGYGEIKTLSSMPDLVDCEATLPVDADRSLDVTYKFVRVGDGMQLQYTISQR